MPNLHGDYGDNVIFSGTVMELHILNIFLFNLIVISIEHSMNPLSYALNFFSDLNVDRNVILSVSWGFFFIL